MKTVLILCAIITCVYGATIPDDTHATVIKYKNKSDGKGTYQFSYETSNGIKRQEQGRVVKSGEPDEHIEVTGRVSFTDSNGKVVAFGYVANKYGYKVVPNDLSERSGAFNSAAIAGLLG